MNFIKLFQRVFLGVVQIAKTSQNTGMILYENK